jgi:thiamine biosynthesis lipoprotein
MKLEFQATGTVWKIEFDLNDQSISEKIRDRISDFEKTYSRFLTDSFITKISNTTGEFSLPDDAKPMFDMYFGLYKQTNGFLTPLIGQNLIEAGYDKEYSLTPKNLNKIADLNEVIDYNFPKIKIKKPVQFDMGGIGKGYLIDIIGDLLKQNKISSFTINAGGDILHYDSKNNFINVGLENPNDKSQVIGAIKISNQSICASSSNRRNWGKFHHIINPKKLESPQDVLATWVIADNAITADSIATCLFLVSADILNTYYNYEYLILNSDFSISKSEKFNAEIYHA